MATPPRLPDAAPTDPSVARGHARLRIVAVGFAIAFGSIGLRLVDMVDWNHVGAPARASLQPTDQLAPQGERDVRVIRDARNAAILRFRADGKGGWLLEGFTACLGTGIAGA